MPGVVEAGDAPAVRAAGDEHVGDGATVAVVVDDGLAAVELAERGGGKDEQGAGGVVGFPGGTAVLEHGGAGAEPGEGGDALPSETAGNEVGRGGVDVEAANPTGGLRAFRGGRGGEEERGESQRQREQQPQTS